MPTLIRFVILNVGVGFLLGAATAASIAIVAPGALGHGEGLDPLAFGLQIYAFGASFGLGALATALIMIAEDLVDPKCDRRNCEATLARDDR